MDTVVGAVGEDIRAWSAADGRLVWEGRFAGGKVGDLEVVEEERGDGNVGGEVKDVIVLLEDAGQAVKRLDGRTGLVKWTYQDTRYVSMSSEIGLGGNE